jgi:NAD(P)-dependent dehydrogenase (short-subunit alcohol dehydrogenase family)
MTTKNLNHKIVVVTGASAGVGRATVRAFAKRGAKIGLLARGRDGLEAARREVEELGSQALVCVTDVANPNQVEAAAAAVEEQFGRIDVWVNNAMVSVFSPVHEMTVEDYRRVTEVTYLGYVWGTLAALRRMRLRDRGVIVQVGSALAYRGIPLQSADCAAKHAIQGFHDSLRCELIHDKSRIRVTMVQMPALNTPQFDWVKSRLPRKAQPAADLPARSRRRSHRVRGATSAARILCFSENSGGGLGQQSGARLSRPVSGQNRLPRATNRGTVRSECAE